MPKIKYTTKELKGPDRFREFLAESLENLSRNFNLILAGIGIAVVALVALYFVSSEDEEKNLAANERFLEAVESYDAGNLEDAVSSLQKLREEHPEADVSVLALYKAGMISYKLGNFEEAITHLELFLAEEIEDDIFRDGANLVIGLSSYKLGRWEKSAEHLLRVNASESPYYIQARRHLGLVYEETGELGKAENIRRETLSAQGR